MKQTYTNFCSDIEELKEFLEMNKIKEYRLIVMWEE